TEQRLARGRFLVEHDLDVGHTRAQICRQRVERLLDVLLEQPLGRIRGFRSHPESVEPLGQKREPLRHRARGRRTRPRLPARARSPPFFELEGVSMMSQQGQLIRLQRAGRDGTPLWAYRYRLGGRDSKRVQRGGFVSEQDAAEALERELERARRERRVSRSL